MMKSIGTTIILSSVLGFFLFSGTTLAQADTDSSGETTTLPPPKTPLAQTSEPPRTATDEENDSSAAVVLPQTTPRVESNPPAPPQSLTEPAAQRTLAHSVHSKPAPHKVAGPPHTQTDEPKKNTAPLAEEQTIQLNPFIALGDEMFLGTAMITAWGITFWDWFETSFHFEKEHGFTQESSTGGADKTGHFYTAYIFADFLNWRLRKQGWSKLRSTLVGSSVAMGLMTWIEVGDATSAYGWSWEDMLADFIGVAVSAGLAMSPVADDLLDFRLEYFPTSSYLDDGVMAADYSGMKYMMALRMTGIKPLKRTPLRFVEWHLGYYTRGFRSFDHTNDTNRVVYFGMGLDLKELFDKLVPKKYMRPFDVAFTYYQVPFASWSIKKWEHPVHNSAPAPPIERFETPTDAPVR